MKLRRAPFAIALVSIALAASLVPLACGGSNVATTGVSKPMSPADGAHDEAVAPGGLGTANDAPTSSEPALAGPEGSVAPGTSSASSTTSPASPADDCPPKCSDGGAWTGCGLKKPRGNQCAGCVPRCKGKGSADEGWYDCAGVLITMRKCT